MATAERNEEFQKKVSKAVKPVVSMTLDLPPSCIEFLPRESASSNASSWLEDRHFFVVGTYNLEKESESTAAESNFDPVGAEKLSFEDAEDGPDAPAPHAPKPQSRNGSLILFSINGDELKLVETVPTPSAILDLHFFRDTPKFAVASSTGTISIYQVCLENTGAEKSEVNSDNARQSEDSGATVKEVKGPPLKGRIQNIATHQIFSSDVIITAFSWCPKNRDNESAYLAATTNDGSVYLAHLNKELTECSLLNDEMPVNRHTLEAWTCVFDPMFGNRLYSGGDDGKLRVVTRDLTNPSDMEYQNPSAHSGHDAGVTAILPLNIGENHTELLTGSYDDYARVFERGTHDAPMKRSRLAAELYIGGGVWRLKLFSQYPLNDDHGTIKYGVLASCMHAGARILELEGNKDGEWSIKILASVEVHESMNYGSDVQPVDKEPYESWDDERVCVSTSFYDRLLFVWKFDPKAV